MSSRVITLTTDFGLKGPFVGVMKGAILRQLPEAVIVDLTHEIPAHWPIEAGFWLARSYQYFPAGTVHVAVVDPGVGTRRNIIAGELDGHLFLAPDNGLLQPLLSQAGARCHRLAEDWRRSRAGPHRATPFTAATSLRRWPRDSLQVATPSATSARRPANSCHPCSKTRCAASMRSAAAWWPSTTSAT